MEEQTAAGVGCSAMSDFVATIALLRGPQGCPWDREQTHASIANNMIEEAYEAVDAIEAQDSVHLCEELGDVLLQVVLQSQIAADEGEFTLDDVCREVNAKMIRRHPHVFGEESARNANEVLDLWDKVKLAEKKHVSEGESQTSVSSEGLLDGVPKSFPALMQAQKISRKAAAAGFEWETLEDVWAQVYEEIDELREAYKAAPKTPDGKIIAGTDEATLATEMEFGDVLFALVNVARRMGIKAESALRTSCSKFRTRWAFMEGLAWARNQRIEDLGKEELERLWLQAKAHEG